MSQSHNLPESNDHKNSNEFQRLEIGESKFWRKVKQDPVVPIGLLEFLLFMRYLMFNLFLKVWQDLV